MNVYSTVLMTGIITQSISTPGLDNPYAAVNWETVEYLHSMSHQHGEWSELNRLWGLGFRHFAFSDYYPSRPRYPAPDAVLQKYPDALGAPNAEHHSTTDVRLHFNALGSFYTTGDGQHMRGNWNRSPIEHVFTNMHVFDAGARTPGEGVYRLKVVLAPQGQQEASVLLSLDGALEAERDTFALIGDGRICKLRVTAPTAEAIIVRATADRLRVRIEFDPALARVTELSLWQGANRPWRQAFREALDGTRRDGVLGPVEGLLYPDGGGITLDHPGGTTEQYLEMLDFDSRVLGIEIWNSHSGFGRRESLHYQLWDDILRTGRRCFGFFVKDHYIFRQGRNVLLVPSSAGLSREARERNALRAYRQGAFFGLIGAMTTDTNGAAVMPYDYSQFRFTRIAIKRGADGAPQGIEAAVTGADAARRPNIQMRFITENGIARHTDGQTQALFVLPRDATGALACRYVRLEAFAYPDTCGGAPLTAAKMAALHVAEIAFLHDRMDAANQPIPVVDMIFSQPIRFGPERTE